MSQSTQDATPSRPHTGDSATASHSLALFPVSATATTTAAASAAAAAAPWPVPKRSKWTIHFKNGQISQQPPLPTTLAKRIPLADWTEFWTKAMATEQISRLEGVVMMSAIALLVALIVISFTTDLIALPMVGFVVLTGLIIFFQVRKCRRWNKFRQEQVAAFQPYGISWERLDKTTGSGDDANTRTWFIFEHVHSTSKTEHVASDAADVV